MTSVDITAEQQPCWRLVQTVTAHDTVVCFLLIFQSDSPLGMLSRQLLSVVPRTAVVPVPKCLTKRWEQAVMQMLACSTEMSFGL